MEFQIWESIMIINKVLSTNVVSKYCMPERTPVKGL